MRDDDRVRILHMIDAAESLEQFFTGRNRADLDTDRMFLFATVRAIEVIGEDYGQTQFSGGISVRMFDVEVRLPDAVAGQIDKELETRLTVALATAIRAYDVEPLVSMVGGLAKELVYDSLHRGGRGEAFPVRSSRSTVPVSVEVN